MEGYNLKQRLISRVRIEGAMGGFPPPHWFDLSPLQWFALRVISGWDAFYPPPHLVVASDIVSPPLVVSDIVSPHWLCQALYPPHWLCQALYPPPLVVSGIVSPPLVVSGIVSPPTGCVRHCILPHWLVTITVF